MKVISQAPCRISLFGGGTDVAPYCNQMGGLCLNMAINIRHKVITADKNKLLTNDNPKFFREFITTPVEHTFDGAIESGLGSSASLAVALVALEAKLKNEKLTRSQMAEKAWEIEVNKLGLFGGKQDQYCASYGGVNLMEFEENGVNVTQLGPSFIEPLVPYLMLFNTGIKRIEPKIQENMKTLTLARKEALDKIKELTKDACVALSNKDIKMVGKLMDIGWELKKKSNNVTTEKIDLIYKKAKKIGAYGGKANGSGGGGYMTFIVPPNKQEKMKSELEKNGCKWVDFSVSWDGIDCRSI